MRAPCGGFALKEEIQVRFSGLCGTAGRDWSKTEVENMSKPVGIDDMIRLGDLTEDGILENLQERYLAEIVYVSNQVLKSLPSYTCRLTQVPFWWQ